MRLDRRAERELGGIALAMAAGLLLAFALALWFGSIGHGFYEADESAHFVNTWFVTDYIRHGLPRSPMGYAMADYLHYPKISIGHWPPAFYGAVGLIFLVLPLNPTSAMIAAAVVAVLPALFFVVPIRRFLGTPAAVVAVLWYMLTPIVGESLYYFFVDQMLAAAVAASAVMWMLFTRRPTYARAVLVGVLFATANLVKGNALLLALLVPLHILITREWGLLANPRTWLAGGVTIAILAPWYILTAGIADDGFNYHAGLSFAWMALKANSVTIFANLGPVGIVAAAIGAAAAFREGGERRDWAALSLALIGATLALHSIIPVALVDRYMAPLLPPLILLAALGFWWAYRRLSRVIAPIVAAGVVALLFALNTIPAFLTMAALPTKIDLRSDRAVQAILAAGAGPAAWLIDGSAGEEGSVIAEGAIADPAKRLYFVRASQLLSSSDFMGRGYRVRFHSTAAVLGELRRLGLAGAVLVHRSGSAAYEHGEQLSQALAAPGSGYHRIGRYPITNGKGETLVFAADGPVAPNLDAVRVVTIPNKAGELGLDTKKKP